MPPTKEKRDFSFPNNARIKRRGEFERIQSRGKKLHTPHFILIFEKARAQPPRLGITVTTKVEPRSVGRNRIKRRIREIFRLNKHRLQQTIDLVVIAKQGASPCTYKEIEQELLSALRHHGLLSKT